MNLSKYAMGKDDDRSFCRECIEQEGAGPATSQPEEMHKLFKCEGVEGNRVKKASTISSDDS